jgi:aminotransferase
VIREMTRLAIQHNAVNLAQGFPDFAAPADLKRAAIEAIEADHNQYSIIWGAKPFRDAIAAKYARAAPGFLAAHQSHHHQHAPQSDREGIHA